MSKNILEDIKPLTKKNGKHEVPHEEGSGYTYDYETAHRPAYNAYEESSDEEENPNIPRRPGFMLWLITGGSIIGLLFVLSFFFSGATITITPKNSIEAAHGTFTAYKTPKEGDLPFEIMSLDAEDNTTVDATKEEDQSIKATGVVTISNNYNFSPQKLVATTRLQSKDGKIYRLVNAVTVPGQSITGGKTIAGTVDAKVVADVPGVEYNLASGDFTIPGLKDSPKFTKFSATVKTAIAGGIVGKVPVVDKDVITKATDDLSKKLTDTLTKQAFTQIPKEYLAYDESKVIVPATEGVTQTSKDGKVVLSEKGTIYLFLFPQKKYTDYILQTVLKQTEEGMTIYNMQDVHIVPDETITSDPTALEKITFKVDGDAKILGTVDEEKIKSALLGKTKSQFPAIMATFLSVDKAELTITPFWIHKISTKSRDITINVQNPF